MILIKLLSDACVFILYLARRRVVPCTKVQEHCAFSIGDEILRWDEFSSHASQKYQIQELLSSSLDKE